MSDEKVEPFVIQDAACGEAHLVLAGAKPRVAAYMVKCKRKITSPRPFAITGIILRTERFPPDAMLMVHSGKRVEVSVPLDQVRKRHLWPLLLFFKGGTEISLASESIGRPFESALDITIHWEAILP